MLSDANGSGDAPALYGEGNNVGDSGKVRIWARIGKGREGCRIYIQEVLKNPKGFTIATMDSSKIINISGDVVD